MSFASRLLLDEVLALGLLLSSPPAALVRV